MRNGETARFRDFFKVPLRNGLTRPKAIRGIGVKMINMGEIFAHDRIRDIHMERVPVSQKETQSFLLEPGDLLFARQSLVLEGAGKCSIFLSAREPVTFESHIIRARLDPNIADPRFFYYFFKSQFGRNVVSSIVEQVAAAGIRGSDLANIKVPNVSVEQQRTVAQILGALDDKIELNREMNHTLEQMAQALFKSWFVDFDPVVAKAAGKMPFGMTDKLAALFPDRFVDSELGPIPEGWMVGFLRDVFRLTMGQSPPGSTYNEMRQGLPFYQGRADFGWRYPSRRIYCSAPARIASPGDTLVTVRAPVGDINMAIEECCIGRGLASVRHIDGHASYTIYAMKNLQADFDIYNGEGTLFGTINKSAFECIKLVLPTRRIVEYFEGKAHHFDALILSNENEMELLTGIRETLLPKLLSGELRIKQAEKIVAEAV